MHSGSDYGSTMKVISVVLANKAFSDILEGDTSKIFVRSACVVNVIKFLILHAFIGKLAFTHN